MCFDTLNTLNGYAFEHRKLSSYSRLQEYPIPSYADTELPACNSCLLYNSFDSNHATNTFKWLTSYG